MRLAPDFVHLACLLMKIIATVDFSAQLKIGDSYELPDSDARLLIAAGLARPGDQPPVSTAPPPATTAMARPRSRQYARRDLQPTDA